MSTAEERALALFASNYNCAQSVLGSVCEQVGLDTDTAFKVASGFGFGVRCGEVCGVVSGAAMAIGLKCGHFIEGDMARKEYCNKKTLEFVEKFREQWGFVACRDLLAVGRAERGDDELSPHEICPKYVAAAVGMLESMEYEAV